MEPGADGFIDLGILAPARTRSTAPEQAAPLPVCDDGFADLSALPEGRTAYSAASKLEGVYASASDVLSSILEATDPHDDSVGDGPEASTAEADGVRISDLPTFSTPAQPAGDIAGAEAHLRDLAALLASEPAVAVEPPTEATSASSPSRYRVAEPPTTSVPEPSIPPEGPGGSDAFVHLFAGFSGEHAAALLAAKSPAVDTASSKDLPDTAALPAPRSHLGAFATTAAPDPSAFEPEPASAAEAARRFAALSPARQALPARLQAMMSEGLASLLAEVGAPTLEAQLRTAGLDLKAAATAAAVPEYDGFEDVEVDTAVPPASTPAALAAGGPASRPANQHAAAAAPLSAPSAGKADTPGASACLRIAIAQVHASPANVPANLAVIEAILASLAGRADLAVFPETFLTGYHIGPSLLRELAVALPTADEIAEAVRRAGGSPQPEHSLLVAARVAARHGVALCLPFAERADATVYNSVAVFDSDGALVAHYRKTQLWHDPAAEPYELAAFAPGPGQTIPHPTLRYVTPPTGQPDPYVPFTLASHPSLPIGLLVCFDCEFPEPARILALRGARVIIGVVASGEPGGFTSQRIVPTRAAESHVCFAWCNFPSAPGPRWTRDPPADAPPPPQCSGGSVVVGPDGRALFALPPFSCAPDRAEEPRAGVSAWGELACIDVEAGAAATAAARSARAARVGAAAASVGAEGAVVQAASSARQASDAPSADGGIVALSPAAHHPASPSLAASDEAVFVARFDPGRPRYAADERRNPYLSARRPTLYAALVAEQRPEKAL